MAGTKAGGKQTAITNKKRHGEDFYAKIALKAQDSWDRNGRKPRGFAANRELASIAGRKGGLVGKRGKA